MSSAFFHDSFYRGNFQTSQNDDIHKDVEMTSDMLKEMLDEEAKYPSKTVLRCFECGEFGNSNIRQCPCQSIYFCNAECQRKSWGRHKKECKYLRYRYQYEKENQEVGLGSAKMLMSAYSSSSSSSNGEGDGNDNNNKSCAVCLEDPNTISTILLRCGHHFCYQCIKDVEYNAKLQKVKVVCPLCRKQIERLDNLVAERVTSLLLLAKTYQLKNNKVEQDKVYALILNHLAFVLDQEPGSINQLEVRGDIYFNMQRYEASGDSYKQCYNGLRRSALVICGKGRERAGSMTSNELFRKDMKTDPGVEFPNDMKQLEKDILPFIAVDPQSLAVSRIFIGIARSLNFSGHTESAIELLELVQKLTKSYGPSHPKVILMNLAFSECYMELGQFDMAKKMAFKAIQQQRYAPGLHRILSQCERKDGNLHKALFYAAKGYYYEEYWNEKLTRNDNLNLWNDIRHEIIRK